jgi:hypothetical protein
LKKEGGRERRRRRGNKGGYIEERTESIIYERGWIIKELAGVIECGRTEIEEWVVW